MFYSLPILIFILDFTTNVPEARIHKNTSPQSINSSAQQSFTSDISIGNNTNTQLQQINSSIQKRTLPNFFPSNHEMEASIKQVSQALVTSVNHFSYLSLNE
jgi:hypothetical protein